MKTKILVALLSFGFIIGLLGCTTAFKDKQITSSGPLEPQAILKFGDVPIPVGFKLLPRDSYCFENAGVRVGLLKYQAKANIDQVVNFYKEQMQMYNWDLLNVIEYGERQLNFDRETETCIITLIPKGKRVSIIISLGPKAQLPKKKADKPIK